MVVAGPLDESSQELTHDIAERVVEVLTAEAVEVFLVDRAGEHLVFGIAERSRERASKAVRRLGADGAWYADWERGNRRGTVAIRDGRMPRPLRTATTWSLYRAWALGAEVFGPAQATVLTFWEPGSSGLLEQIGVRGQSRFDERSAETTEVLEAHRYPGRAAFPVANRLERFHGEIDVVYTWVDGSDERWRGEFEEWSSRDGRDVTTDRDLDEARFRDNDELRYSLRSLWFNCNWVRRIFLVTADQVPAWLNVDEGSVEVVSHRDILPQTCLPTFNSHAIESSLHRIDGLSDRFVYFNDDVFAGRPLRPDHFFTSSGLPKVFQSDAAVPGVNDLGERAIDNAAIRGRRLLARDFGRVAAFKPHHAPFALSRGVLDELSKRYTDEFDATMHHRFRHPDDISVAASLAQNYALATGQAVLGSLAVEYVHLESARLRWHLDRLLLGRRFDTFCINETETPVADRRRAAALIREFLAEYFPAPAPWERRDHAP
jgi:hypothetical protein